MPTAVVWAGAILTAFTGEASLAVALAIDAYTAHATISWASIEDLHAKLRRG
jgi:hypothetical protein